jgi:hypothetical protein
MRESSIACPFKAGCRLRGGQATGVRRGKGEPDAGSAVGAVPPAAHYACTDCVRKIAII